jgi:hypothetical protein
MRAMIIYNKILILLTIKFKIHQILIKVIIYLSISVIIVLLERLYKKLNIFPNLFSILAPNNMFQDIMKDNGIL